MKVIGFIYVFVSLFLYLCSFASHAVYICMKCGVRYEGSHYCDHEENLKAQDSSTSTGQPQTFLPPPQPQGFYGPENYGSAGCGYLPPSPPQGFYGPEGHSSAGCGYLPPNPAQGFYGPEDYGSAVYGAPPQYFPVMNQAASLVAGNYPAPSGPSQPFFIPPVVPLPALFSAGTQPDGSQHSAHPLNQGAASMENPLDQYHVNGYERKEQLKKELKERLEHLAKAEGQETATYVKLIYPEVWHQAVAFQGQKILCYVNCHFFGDGTGIRFIFQDELSGWLAKANTMVTVVIVDPQNSGYRFTVQFYRTVNPDYDHLIVDNETVLEIHRSKRYKVLEQLSQVGDLMLFSSEYVIP